MVQVKLVKLESPIHCVDTKLCKEVYLVGISCSTDLQRKIINKSTGAISQSLKIPGVDLRACLRS